MLINNIELDVKTKCIESEKTQAQIAENIGITPSYVNRIVKSKEHIINKTFLAMMEAKLLYLIQTHNGVSSQKAA
jgi:transcriptional regulator with XRE-family HTH domain